MLDWLNTLTEKPDHPMHSVEEAERLLSGLSDEPPRALEEITSWLTTLTSATGFKLATRIAIVKRVDESGRPLEPLLTRQYLRRSISDFERVRLWQIALEFWQRVADAYGHCLGEMRRDTGTLAAHRRELTPLIVRTLRALANQCRVLRLRHMPIGEPLWRALFDFYVLSESERCEGERVTAYDGETLPTSPRTELVRALMLEIARPESMQPAQTELAARVTVRYADAVLFKSTPEAGCNWYVDLAQPRAPELATGTAALQPTARFFGAGAVLVKVQEMLRRMAAQPGIKEQRFGEDHTSEEKLAMLQRLTRYWGDQAPHRREPRHTSKAEINVAQGWAAACQKAPRASFNGWAELIVGLDAETKARLGITTEPIAIPEEKWLRHDASHWGLGAEMPRASESRVRIGALLALTERGGPPRLGLVRRLYHDHNQSAFAGIEVLAKKPVTAILCRIGHGGMQIARHDTVTGTSTGDYLNAILLDGNEQEGRRLELLLARGEFIAGLVYDALVGQAKRPLKVEELLEHGEDFERVRYVWLKKQP